VYPYRETYVKYHAEFYEFIDASERERYYELMGEGDVAFCGSIYEGTGIANLEQAYSGMLMVYLYEPWMKNRIPPNYPLVARNEKELAEIFNIVVDASECLRLRDAWVDKLVEHTRKIAGIDEAKRIMGLIDECVRKHVESFEEKKIRLYDVMADITDARFGDIDEFFRRVGMLTRTKMSKTEVENMMSKIGARLLLRKYGYRDVGFEKAVYER
jgi:hypothetical protein